MPEKIWHLRSPGRCGFLRILWKDNSVFLSLSGGPALVPMWLAASGNGPRKNHARPIASRCSSRCAGSKRSLISVQNAGPAVHLRLSQGLFLPSAIPPVSHKKHSRAIPDRPQRRSRKSRRDLQPLMRHNRTYSMPRKTEGPTIASPTMDRIGSICCKPQFSNPCRGCAGLNRHVVGEEESLQERRKRLHPDPESCGGRS